MSETLTYTCIGSEGYLISRKAASIRELIGKRMVVAMVPDTGDKSKQDAADLCGRWNLHEAFAVTFRKIAEVPEGQAIPDTLRNEVKCCVMLADRCGKVQPETVELNHHEQKEAPQC